MGRVARCPFAAWWGLAFFFYREKEFLLSMGWESDECARERYQVSARTFTSQQPQQIGVAPYQAKV